MSMPRGIASSSDVRSPMPSRCTGNSLGISGMVF